MIDEDVEVVTIAEYEKLTGEKFDPNEDFAVNDSDDLKELESFDNGKK